MADSTPSSTSKGRLKRIVDRVKTSIKKRLSKFSKPGPTEGQRQAAEGSQQPATSTPAAATTATGPSQSAGQQPPPGTEGRIVFRTTLDKEKVQALFAKYGIEFDGESVVVSQIDQSGKRVEKPIRMRVRRQCHNCQKTFTRNLVCSQCSHRYCRNCYRYPPKKPKNKGSSSEAAKQGKDTVEKPIEPPAGSATGQ